MYEPVDPKVSFPDLEVEVLSFWEENDVFKRSLENRKGNEEFVFYDGPPFATGLPHFGHFVPGTIKDIIPRYQTMKGKYVDRRFGWDCHGLPVEYEMEKELVISGRAEIENYGVGKFNEACRSIVLRYTSQWRDIVTRMGRWVDFDNDYKTMDPDYMETIWWVFKQLWEQGLVYEGYYILPYSPGLATPLSNFEVNLGGYWEITDPAITVRFRVREDVEQPVDFPENTYLLAWTTTPWTLPSNLGITFGPEVTYVLVRDGDEHYVLAEERLSDYYRSEEEYEIVKRLKGSELNGVKYEPLFPYFEHLKDEGAFRSFVADYVTTEEGTGIVHTAPGFGEEDYEVMQGTGIPVIVPIDADAKFTSEVTDFEGMFVKDADKEIIRKLKEEGKLIKRENYVHSYPHCYRTNQPLIYRAVSSWFVDIQKIKDKMLGANDRINWVPEHIKTGRFGKWLEGAKDWAISRNRYWGNPIPIWKSDGGDYTECIGSRSELEEKSGQKVPDLHKHYVDEITWPAPDGSGTMRRIPEVLDCWFESGSMPYAQNHYPFENKEFVERNFPADFICEGLDQTRGWFYTLTVLAAALFDSPAFRNCVVNGLVLAPDGKKMSKSQRNYTDPVDVIKKFGADALRLFLMHSAVVRGEDLRYTDDGVKDVLKNVIIPLWNSYSFFVTYANIDGVQPTGAPAQPGNPLDQWILSESLRLTEQVTANLDAYDLQRAIDPIVAFIDNLNNWYIRRSRRRFWRSENDSDKQEAYGTLYEVLMRVVKVAAPFIPFVTEAVFRNLRTDKDPDSVHLCDYPQADPAARDTDLEWKMSTVQRTVRMGRALRRMHDLKIRQPLSAIHLVTRNDAERRVLREMEDIIRDELNVKEVIFRENEEELVEFSAKPNYRVLGRELGKDMKIAEEKIGALSAEEIQGLIEGRTLNIDLDTRTLDLTADRVQIQRFEKENLKVLNEGSLTVALDPELTEDLMNEGLVRDLIRAVQNLRKESGLDVTDRVILYVDAGNNLSEAIGEFEDYLMSETLALSVRRQKHDDARPVEVGGEECRIAVEKA
ncbi:MAG: isoleucine--tRNA ligase [Spirochaetota bacterium]